MFSSTPTARSGFGLTEGLVVQVLDQPSDADWIQLFAGGDETTFSPFLTGLARQNPSLDPLGSIGLNFRFPPTHFSSDAFPTSIDPLATVPQPLSTTGIFGRVEGVSLQTPTSGFQEWMFHFNDRSVEHELHAQQRNAEQHIFRNDQLGKPRRLDGF